MNEQNKPTTAAPLHGIVLLPCPFCGRSDKLRLMFTNWRLAVNCYACGIDGPSVNMSDGEAAAKEAWNYPRCIRQ
jgi:Lar family restriction alleviation protein